MEITYRVGDATYPGGGGLRIIAHICNNVGAWGSGFVVAVSKRWAAPERTYRAVRKHALGTNQYVFVDSATLVANMIAQDGITGHGRKVSYTALKKCLQDLKHFAQREKELGNEVSIHMPRIGTARGGGKWEEIEPIIYSVFDLRCDIPVTVYDLPKTASGT